MKRFAGITLILLVLLSCNRKNDLNLNANDIVSIKIIAVAGNEQRPVRNIEDSKLIAEIIDCINHASPEPIKFIPVYKLVFYSRDGNFDAAINGEALSIKDGKKYRFKCDFEELIK